MLFGEHIPTIALSNQPTSGAWFTCDLEIPEDSYKLCLRAGKAQASGLRGTGGQKAVPNCQRILQEHLCRWQGLESHQAAHAGHGPWAGHSIALSAAPPAPPAEAARSQPAASRVPGEATDSPKAAMNAFLRPLPAHWHTSAPMCPAEAGTPACPGDTSTGKGHRSLTFRIRRCLDRSANPCAFASLCHACRWSGGQHPLRYGRDIRHSWCLTLSPSGTFSP